MTRPLRITVVTPSLNQGPFLERTIRSVLGQEGAFELEYLVVDGGSTDETLSILRRYEGRLQYVSEPDRGQSDAINKGFRRATGDVVAWLNSDDTYEAGALDAVARALGAGAARWCFGQCRVVDAHDREIRRYVTAYKNHLARRYSYRLLLTKDFIPQPATFFRRELLEQVGRLDESRHLAMDYDLWLRFAQVAEPLFLPEVLAAFRWHAGSKSGGRYAAAAREAFEIARRHANGGARVALARHFLHVVALTATYSTLDALDRARAR